MRVDQVIVVTKVGLHPHKSFRTGASLQEVVKWLFNLGMATSLGEGQLNLNLLDTV